MVWGGFAVLAGIMLISLGLWPIVVWPFVLYWWVGHLGKALTAYQSVVKPKKWEQNVVVNVTAGPTEGQIVDAANRALDERSKYYAK